MPNYEDKYRAVQSLKAKMAAEARKKGEIPNTREIDRKAQEIAEKTDRKRKGW